MKMHIKARVPAMPARPGNPTGPSAFRDPRPEQPEHNLEMNNVYQPWLWIDVQTQRGTIRVYNDGKVEQVQ